MSGSGEGSERNGIVLRVEEKGESFWSLAVFFEVEGLTYPLLRRSRKVTRPDLFDTAAIMLRPGKGNGPAFAEAYRVVQRREGIGRSYDRITTASHFAEVLRRNTQHLADPTAHFPLCLRFFDSVAGGTAPEAAYLKTLFLFASTEGLPVREDWAGSLSEAEERDLADILRTPLAVQKVSSASCRALAQALETWLVREAHFVINQR